MTTRRGAKEKTPLTEGEIEVISANLAQREAQFNDKVTAFQQRCEEFVRECADRKQGEIDLESNFTALRDELRREINNLCVETTSSHAYGHMAPPGEDRRDRDHHPREFEPNGITENPKVSFREATESIPSFDGYNISLAQFARACRRAREIVPPSSEYNLTKLIINRLRGRAYYAVEDEPCNNITQLIDLLNGAFGSPKTIDQYRGELSACYLKAGEHMLDYISKLKDLRTAILDAERRETGTLSSITINNVDELTARSFCDGLPLQYRLQMRQEHYIRPFEAFSAAKVLAKREELDRQRNARAGPSPRPSTVPRVPEYYRQTDRYRPLPQRYERDAASPRAIANGPQTSSPSPDTRAVARYQPNATRPATQSIWCRYCKASGHEIQDCRKRIYNNNPRPGNYQGPSTRQDPSRAGQHSSQAIRSIEATPEERSESESSEQEHLHTPPQ